MEHDWALAPLRVRGLTRVRLHVDLTILAKMCAQPGASRCHRRLTL
jgi:hypothetical protein